MSKVVVFILDKIVWMLLITVLTTQALQIAGIIDTPKGLSDISYSQPNEYNYELSVDNNNEFRGKRHAQVERSKFIDSLFNIPISTLNAVNNLVQSSRPAFKRLRDFAFKRIEKITTKGSTSTTTTTTSTTISPESNNVFKRSYPVYIRAKSGENITL